MTVAVLGAGAWGTAMAIHLARRGEAVLWSRSDEQCVAMRGARANERYLPGHAFPSTLRVTERLTEALAGADLVLIAVTSQGLRAVAHEVAAAGCAAPVICLCKGFEPDRARLPHQVCSEELGASAAFGALSGPSFAAEVAAGLPTAVTLAATDATLARRAARMLHGGALRVYSSDDLIGVEVAGAVKNVIAIAAGIADGLHCGLNARAALITRGLAEMTRLGVRLGGRAETFMGLAGAGDLILTCTGELSRNRRVGLALGRGEPLATILDRLGHVAEGVNTAYELNRMSRDLGVDMPITSAVCRVLRDHRTARAAANALLQREPRPEG